MSSFFSQNIEYEFSIVTLISLIVGSPDYEDFFEKDREKSLVYQSVAIVLYLLFIILMCVVFINFLLGLTITDVKVIFQREN